MRELIAGLVVGIIVAIIMFLVFSGRNSDCRAREEADARQIAELTEQITRLHKENEGLAAALTKVQAEETSLAAQNEELSKEVATVKATGKLPPPPPAPPPK
ncbi:MAG TPA: hypothetical protein VMU16_10440 [Candidatus Binataceae bacterium]|nr:hypothetical protein [Candidatus Binataceae bacterium]